MATVVAGTLYIVATPIGNLGDLTARGRDVLSQVDAICAEDTRHTRQLLSAYGLERPLISLHDHNEAEVSWRLVERLRGGESLALVSDGRDAVRGPAAGGSLQGDVGWCESGNQAARGALFCPAHNVGSIRLEKADQTRVTLRRA